MDEKLVTENMGLIYLAIKKMHLTSKTEDEFQAYYDAGLEGLIKGAKKYDKNSGYKPSSFLYTCIANEIKHHLSLKTMPKRLNPAGSDISLNYLMDSEDDRSNEFIDMMPDPNVNIEEDVEKKLEVERLLYAVNQLKNEKDKLALKMYYGLEGYTPGTYESVAKKIGVSRNAIYLRLKGSYPKLKRILENSREVFIMEQPKQEKSIEKVQKEEKTKKLTTLNDLNSILFKQLASLDDDNADFEKEIRKSYAVSQIAQQIIANTNTCIKALKLAAENKINNKNELEFIGLTYEK